MMYDYEPYKNSIDNYRSALEDALYIAQDPFKAPEQVVATSKLVMEACWAMQIEYSAMMCASDRKK